MPFIIIMKCLYFYLESSQKPNLSDTIIVLCRSQPINNQCGDWTSPCGSYYDCKIPFSNNHKRTLKKSILLMGWGNYIAHMGPHCGSHRQTDRWYEQAWSSAFTGVQAGDLWFCGLFFLVNLKHKSRNVKHGKKQIKQPKWSVI